MVTAKIKHLPTNYRKVQPVLALIRGRTVADALVILEHTPRRAQLAVTKLLKSAQANAKNNHNYRPDSLVIAEVFVTVGSRLRRNRLAPRRHHGRRWPVPYQRHTCHVKVVLDGQQRAKAIRPPAAEIAAKKAEKTTKEGGE